MVNGLWSTDNSQRSHPDGSLLSVVYSLLTFIYQRDYHVSTYHLYLRVFFIINMVTLKLYRKFLVILVIRGDMYALRMVTV